MFEQTFKNIDDALWKDAGASSELDYTEQTSWLLFLKYLDDLEKRQGSRSPAFRQAIYAHSGAGIHVEHLGGAQVER